MIMSGKAWRSIVTSSQLALVRRVDSMDSCCVILEVHEALKSPLRTFVVGGMGNSGRAESGRGGRNGAAANVYCQRRAVVQAGVAWHRPCNTDVGKLDIGVIDIGAVRRNLRIPTRFQVLSNELVSVLPSHD